MSVDNGDLRCKMDDGMGSAGETTKNDPEAHVVEWKPKRSTMTTAKALGSDMMRRRCDASKLAGWQAGTGPAEGGTTARKHQATHRVYSIWRDRLTVTQSPTKTNKAGGFVRIQS
ncbi:hypothetical protein QR685DRAFT_595265 [Neurospora intermedia]|uniref:Uncharacterized protein n=1 Tax=Neurospora intermedia TaxID=5142 RepID=A0ABR3DLL2_NEUIN